MAYEQMRLDRPLSRFELVVTVALIAVFTGYFLNRILVLTIVAEERYLETTINRMRSELMIYTAEKLIKGNYGDIYQLYNANPVGTAIEVPRNYAGSHNAITTGEIEPGQWVYLNTSKQLVYRVMNGDYFSNNTTGQPMVRISLELVYNDRDKDGTYTEGTDLPQGIALKIMDEYAWTY